MAEGHRWSPPHMVLAALNDRARPAPCSVPAAVSRIRRNSDRAEESALLPVRSEDAQDFVRGTFVRDGVGMRVERADPQRARVLYSRERIEQIETLDVLVGAHVSNAVVQIAVRIMSAAP